MPPIDPQLVQRIADEVIRAIQSQGEAGDRSPDESSGVPPTNVRPPIGICTGDYSKFPELQGRLNASPPAASATATAGGSASAAPAPGAASAAEASPLPMSGIITANQLEEAIASSPTGVAALAHDARLTPLANDFARQHPEKVDRLTPGNHAALPDATRSMSWLWWIDGQCPAVDTITQQRASSLRPIAATRAGSSTAQVVREIASAMHAERATGALLFVRSAAQVMCFANRCASLRAVVGTCGEAVEEGITQLGANVLVLEYPHQGPKAMAAMVDRMMQHPPQLSAAVQRQLAELHRCP